VRIGDEIADRQMRSVDEYRLDREAVLPEMMHGYALREHATAARQRRAAVARAAKAKAKAKEEETTCDQ